MKRLILAALAIFAIAVPTAAAFNHKQRTPTVCQVAGSAVSSTGLPADETLNFLYLDANGGYLGGYVIGVVNDGDTISDNTVNRPSAGVASYAVTGELWGNVHFVTYSECAA